LVAVQAALLVVRTAVVLEIFGPLLVGLACAIRLWRDWP
jgi:hypothetical protein